MFHKMRKSLGSKRKEMGEKDIASSRGNRTDFTTDDSGMCDSVTHVSGPVWLNLRQSTEKTRPNACPYPGGRVPRRQLSPQPGPNTYPGHEKTPTGPKAGRGLVRWRGEYQA